MNLDFIFFISFVIFGKCIGANKNANEKLIECCAHDSQIDKYCAAKYCDFGKINQFSVFPFITECAARGNTINRMWNCISSRHDHTQCCKNQRVLPLCQEFCNASKSVPVDILKYGFCVQEFEKYRLCFRTFLKHNNAIHQ